MELEQSEFEWWLGDYLRETDDETTTRNPAPAAPLSAAALLPSSQPRCRQESAPLRKAEWRSIEDLVILASYRKYGTQWSRIAAQLPGRTPDGVRNRWHRLQRRHGLSDSVGGRRGLDELLLSCGVEKDWVPPAEALHFIETEDDDADEVELGRTMWTEEEDALVLEGVRTHGFKWRLIAAKLPGRSDSSVRNRWRRLPEAKLPRPDHTLGGGVAALSPLGRFTTAPTFSVVPRRAPAQLPPPLQLPGSPSGVPSHHGREDSVDSDFVDLVHAAVEEWTPLTNFARRAAAAGSPPAPHAAGQSGPDCYTDEDRPLAFETGAVCPMPPEALRAPEARTVGVPMERLSPLRASTGEMLPRDAPALARSFSSLSAVGSSSTTMSTLGSTSAATATSDNEEPDDATGAIPRGSGRKRFRPMWTAEEDVFIVRYVEQHGRQWAKIAGLMENRSHRAVRNRWLRMQKGQATRESRGPDDGYRCRRCGELKLGHICAASLPRLPSPPQFCL